MILIRGNVEIHTDDEQRIEILKSDGYREVKAGDGKTKGKGDRKASKSD